MIPSRTWLNAVAALIGADTNYLAQPTTFVLVTLLKAAFTPGPDLDIATLVPADFTGSAAKHAASAATQVFRDNLTGNQILQVNEPAGGWHWQASVAPAPAQVIYGYMLTTSDGATLIASERFETNVNINAVGDGVDIGEVRIILPPDSFI